MLRIAKIFLNSNNLHRKFNAGYNTGFELIGGATTRSMATIEANSRNRTTFVSETSPTTIRVNLYQYFQGKGEILPFEDGFFDLIIIDNVLDHCENPTLVLNEINRSLKIGGIIFFRQNLYNKWGKLLRTIMEFFKIDKGHPFTFTKQFFTKNINNRMWNIKHIEEDGYYMTWKNNLTNISFKGIIQTIFFIVRSRSLFILIKS